MVGGEEVGFVDDHDDVFVAFVFFRGERVGGLGDQRCFVESGHATKGSHDAGVEAAGTDSRVAEIDDGVTGRVEVGGGGAGGDGLARADLASDHAKGTFADAPVDAGDGFAVAGAAVQHLGCEVASEGHAGEAVVALEDFDAHGVSLSGSVVWVRSAYRVARVCLASSAV